MTLSNQTTVNVQEKSNLIWAIADLIRDFYKPHEYGKVILPMWEMYRDYIDGKKEIVECNAAFAAKIEY